MTRSCTGDRHPFAPALEALEDRTVPSSVQGPITAGVFDPSTARWFLRNELSAGAPDAGQFAFGAPGWRAITGDWKGTGNVGIGVVDPATNTWYLRNEASAGGPDAGQFRYGAPGWIPLVGDWTGTGHDGIGAFDPSTGTFYLRNEANAGGPDAGVFKYGGSGWMPVVGDWTGSGHTGIGVVDPATNTFYLRNEAGAGGPDAGTFPYGAPGWLPLAGDWTGSGQDGIGVVDPNSGTFYLRNETNSGRPDAGQFAFGGANLLPVLGNFRQAPTTLFPVNALQTVLSNGQLLLSGAVGSTGLTAPITLSATPASSNSSTPILNLHLDPIHLNLLGLQVDTSPICLAITAQSGPGNLLGNLLSDLANSLNQGQSQSQVLNGLSPTQVTTLTTGLTSLLNSTVSSLTGLLGTTPAVTNSGGSSTTNGTNVLTLSLGPLDLNLLGLNVHLDNCSNGPVTVSITAVPGPGNLLGNLIGRLAHLLDTPGSGNAVQRLLTLIARDITNLL